MNICDCVNYTAKQQNRSAGISKAKTVTVKARIESEDNSGQHMIPVYWGKIKSAWNVISLHEHSSYGPCGGPAGKRKKDCLG